MLGDLLVVVVDICGLWSVALVAFLCRLEIIVLGQLGEVLVFEVLIVVLSLSLPLTLRRLLYLRCLGLICLLAGSFDVIAIIFVAIVFSVVV